MTPGPGQQRALAVAATLAAASGLVWLLTGDEPPRPLTNLDPIPSTAPLTSAPTTTALAPGSVTPAGTTSTTRRRTSTTRRATTTSARVTTTGVTVGPPTTIVIDEPTSTVGPSTTAPEG